MDICRFQVDKLTVEIHSDNESCGEAAAKAAAEALSELSRGRSTIGVIFATGASQLDILHALLRIDAVPWAKILGFHLDEYVGIKENHPASFRGYLRQNLTSRVTMREFSEIDGNAADGNAADLDGFCRSYAKKLREADPQLCLLGIGENGHLAFNDPGEADFHDPQEMKVVVLDKACREQQVAEGWFGNLEEVPERALTLTIPTIFHIPRLILTVPGGRKAQIVKRALREQVSEDCPATILRTHPNAKLFLDAESAAELDLNNMMLSAR